MTQVLIVVTELPYHILLLLFSLRLQLAINFNVKVVILVQDKIIEVPHEELLLINTLFFSYQRLDLLSLGFLAFGVDKVENYH